MIKENDSDVELNPNENEINIEQNNHTILANTHDNPVLAANPKPWDVLKATVSFRALLEADGHHFRQSGKYYMCCCPFHDDRTPSFAVLPEDTHGRCFGCSWYGNIFDYVMKFRKVDFKEALRRLEKKSSQLQRGATVLATPTRKAIQLKIDGKHIAERRRYLERLQTDEWLQEHVCELRAGNENKWRPTTIKSLAAEGSLGWAGDAFAFIYKTGTKYRKWPGKDFRWDDCSIGNSLWRENRIVDAQHVYMTEGETDAISLLDAGLEESGDIAIVAAPGASSFVSSWGEMFRGKNVILCFDNDEAGEKGMERTGTLLTGIATNVSYIDLKEVA